MAKATLKHPSPKAPNPKAPRPKADPARPPAQIAGPEASLQSSGHPGTNATLQEAELHRLQAEIERCRQCRSLKPWRKFGRDAYGASGVGYLDVAYLMVGEAPGRVSWQRRRRFTGPAGLLIRRALSAVGDDRYRDLEDLFYMTDVVKCHPGGAGDFGANRSPTASEVRACTPFLERELQVLKPRVIITFGKKAGESVAEAVASCRITPEVLAFPHPSPRNQQTILKSYRSMRHFQQALTATFRQLIARLDGDHSPRKGTDA